MATDLLIATNGYKGTWPAIEYGAWLASILDLKITLLGVKGKMNPSALEDHHSLEDIFEQAVELFKSRDVEYILDMQTGNAEELIPRKAREGDYLTILGRLGRPQIRRILTGRSIRQLIEQIENPILYVPEMKFPVKKVLMCIGGLGYEITAEHLAIRIAIKSGADVTLLHIVPPMDLDYPTARAIRENWQALAKTDTPIGHSLRQALEIAEAGGITAQIKARQGNIVEEILDELKQENYDLLCMGSRYSANALRQMFAPNITADVAEAANIPILTARYKRQE